VALTEVAFSVDKCSVLFQDGNCECVATDLCAEGTKIDSEFFVVSPSLLRRIAVLLTRTKDPGQTSFQSVLSYVGTRDCKKQFFGVIYQGADKSLARPTSRCISFDGENILFDASLVIYINSTNIPPIVIINRIYGHQNLLLL
jgi:hypothetical protein